MDVSGELTRDDVVVLLGSVPERLADMVSGLDETRLRYRHGPAFPTLLELIAHLCEAGAGVDALLRRAQIDGQERLDVRATIDPAVELPPGASLAELLDDYARVRRRSVDFLRGMSAQDWQRGVTDPQIGALTLHDVGRLATRHELGHLTQVRNLIAVLPQPEDLGPVAVTSPAPDPPMGDPGPM